MLFYFVSRCMYYHIVGKHDSFNGCFFIAVFGLEKSFVIGRKLLTKYRLVVHRQQLVSVSMMFVPIIRRMCELHQLQFINNRAAIAGLRSFGPAIISQMNLLAAISVDFTG